MTTLNDMTAKKKPEPSAEEIAAREPWGMRRTVHPVPGIRPMFVTARGPRRVLTYATGEVELQVPRDREGTFEPVMCAPRRSPCWSQPWRQR